MPDIATRLHRLEEGTLGALMGALVLIAAGQIILRSFFSVSLPWADPLVRHLVLWSGFLGAAIACRLDKHIRIDALLRLCPARWTLLMEAVGNLFSSSICALLVWTSIRFVLDEKAYAAVSFGNIPTWVLQLIFPLAFTIMAARFLTRGGRQLWSFWQGHSRQQRLRRPA
jgi:TRAP-type C4-dicarboxylate transport system permease small subunit